MELKIERLLDTIGKKIVAALQKNARISFSDLGRKVGLSTPAATERVRKLEDAGVISGYHAAVDAAKVGFPVTAFIHLTTPVQQYAKVIAVMEQLNEIRECHHISGEESFIIKTLAPSVKHLESLVQKLSLYGRTRTAIVLSSSFVKSAIDISAEALK
jgi:Lrp/AsnC family leucine-responsive transcriptional regulator